MNAITRSDARNNKLVDATLKDGALQVGAQESAVKVVERMLKLAGFNPGIVDNRYTAQTAQALKQFQQSVGLPSTGALDSQTFARLKNVQARIHGHQDGFEGVGQKSQAILKNEQRLARLGYHVGHVDGVYDATTAKAVTEFRKDQPADFKGHTAGVMGTAAQQVLAREAKALQHAPEHQRHTITSATRRLDSATATAARKTNPDGTTGLGVGSRGAVVADIQKHLQAAGYSPKHTQGVFDERTAGAVTAFQRASHLPATGRVDGATWDKLRGSIQSNNAPMTVGEHSQDVLKAERMLAHLGYKTGKVDGRFDQATLAASRKFERSHKGNGSDGSINAHQMTAMHKAVVQKDSQGGGRKAMEIANSVLGRNAGDIKLHGKLAKDMDDWVPNNVNCANFVSAVLEQAGMISNGQHHDAVTGLRDNLRKDKDWQEQRTLHGAKPGDVVMFHTSHSWGHVVLFAGWDHSGQPLFIGSNNVNSDGSQRITKGHMGYAIDGVFHYKH